MHISIAWEKNPLQNILLFLKVTYPFSPLKYVPNVFIQNQLGNDYNMLGQS